MTASRIAIFLALALILGVPFALRPAAPRRESGPVQTLVVITPHVPQIRSEFATAFSAWHQRHYATPVTIDYRTPGGTSEIITQLQSVYSSEGRRILTQLARSNPEQLSDPPFKLSDLIQPASMTQDVVFGGGSFDHGRLKNGRTASIWAYAFPGGKVQTV